MNVFDQTNLAEVARFLKLGGVLAYPSESVWGLGCDGFDEQAVAKILRLKSRPIDKGLIVLTDDAQKLMPLLVDLPQYIQQSVMNKLQEVSHDHVYKQATTWLLPVAASSAIPKFLTGAFDTLAVRVTKHPVLAHICQIITDEHNPYGFLVSTSCNVTGQPPATNLSSAMMYFGEQVGYLDSYHLGFDKPSRIIDVLTDVALRLD